MFAAVLLLSLAGNALAQSNTDTVAATTTAAASGTGSAATATLSVNSDLPPTPLATVSGYTIPDIASFTSGQPTSTSIPLATSYTAGYTPTLVSGAPAIPTAVKVADFPSLDAVPPTDSDTVKAWLAKIDFTKVPSYNVTDGTCAGSPSAVNDGRCWWTCGGCTRATDITECPDKFTWGVSYDDGPSDYTPVLLDYLSEQQIKTTFFVVGSRVLSRPEILKAEYAQGHQISVHTWSHPSLTTLTNEQIVAEFGWTMKVIHDTIGVTPNTFRPPYGDIDDRVRAIAAQMGLTPIMWTSYTNTTTGVKTTFDTTDWHIPGGTATGASALSKFEEIVSDYAPKLDTGFIVLQHDLYQQTVDLAVGYIIPMAQASANHYVFKSIIDCLGRPLSEAYIETSSNTTATQITSAASTFYQATVGTQTGSAVVATSATESAGAASSGGSGTASGGSSATSSASSGSAKSIEIQGVFVPIAASLMVIAAGMAIVA